MRDSIRFIRCGRVIIKVSDIRRAELCQYPKLDRKIRIKDREGYIKFTLEDGSEFCTEVGTYEDAEGLFNIIQDDLCED